MERLNYCNQICIYLVNSTLQIAVVILNGSWCTNITIGIVKISRVFSWACTTSVEVQYLLRALGFHVKYSGASNVLSCRADSLLVSLWARVPQGYYLCYRVIEELAVEVMCGCLFQGYDHNGRNFPLINGGICWLRTHWRECSCAMNATC